MLAHEYAMLAAFHAWNCLDSPERKIHWLTDRGGEFPATSVDPVGIGCGARDHVDAQAFRSFLYDPVLVQTGQSLEDRCKRIR